MRSPVASCTAITTLCNFGQIIEIIPPVKIGCFYLLSWDMEVWEVFAIFMNLVLLSYKLQPWPITFSISHNGNDHVVMEAEVSIVFGIRQVRKNLCRIISNIFLCQNSQQSAHYKETSWSEAAMSNPRWVVRAIAFPGPWQISFVSTQNPSANKT